MRISKNAQDGAPINDRLLIFKRLLVLRAFVLASLALYVVVFTYHPSAIATVALLLGISIGYSLIAWRVYAGGRPISVRVIMAQLIWDGMVILLFVFATGRSTNPFIYYLLVIIAISASLFRERTVWMFSASGILAYSALMYMDMHLHMSHMDTQFRSHLLGMWINFVASAILISFFISRLTAALKSHERALGLAREEILKNEQLIGIGTLAASTVHSFGTPLSTIAMATSEIEELHGDRETAECTAIIKTQIERCKNTMAKLSSLTIQSTSPYVTLDSFVAEIKEHFMLMNTEPMPSFTLNDSAENRGLPGGILLLHAIINLADNAIRAAKSTVNIRIEALDRRVQIVIEDDGIGIAPDALEHFGEAIFSSKTGLGIGFLLANSTIERLGGSVRFANPIQSHDLPLTRVTVELPLITDEPADES